MDIEMFNYVDILMRKSKMGILFEDVKSKSRGSSTGQSKSNKQEEDGERKGQAD